MSDDLLTRLRVGADNEALGIGEAWVLLDEAAEALAQAQEDVAALKAGWPATLVAGELLTQAERERDEARDHATVLLAEVVDARAMLAECRPIVGRADAVFLPPKGTCLWGPAEKAALLARMDAALGGEA